jgi:hypothetical protein
VIEHRSSNNFSVLKNLQFLLNVTHGYIEKINKVNISCFDIQYNHLFPNSICKDDMRWLTRRRISLCNLAFIYSCTNNIIFLA